MTTDSNIKIFLLCPVPENQKPINEFFNFQENSFLSWITFPKKKFQKKFFENYLKIFLFGNIFFPFSEKSIISFFLLNLFFTTCFFLLIFSSFYIRGIELEKNFNKSRFFYEEASWYDGQIWEKPLGVIKNDRLLSTQKIQPIIQRISINIFSLSLFLFFLLILVEKN
jgi:hypothetical protein